eukprot:SAG11_NODE_3021_length_2757_cov_2.291196_1_plen_86_part_00
MRLHAHTSPALVAAAASYSSCCSRRAASTSTAVPRSKAVAGRGELVRNYINRALYDPEHGYFSSVHCLHSPPKPLDFQTLRGCAE